MVSWAFSKGNLRDYSAESPDVLRNSNPLLFDLQKLLEWWNGVPHLSALVNLEIKLDRFCEQAVGVQPSCVCARSAARARC